MGMDRNTVIGFVLIGLLLVGMFYFNSKSSLQYQAEQKRIQDSIARLKPKVDVLAQKADSIKIDSIRKIQSAGGFQQYVTGSDQSIVLENDVVKITFTNKGAYPKIVELKKYKAYDGNQVLVQKGNFNKIEYPINAADNKTLLSTDLYFTPGAVAEAADHSKSISFTLDDSTGKKIVHQYTLHPGEYMVDFSIQLNGADKLVSQNALNITWLTEADKIEKDLKYEKQQTQFAYLQDGEFDFEHAGQKSSEKKFEKPVNWLAVKQQFFIASLIAKNKFESVNAKWVVPEDTATHVLTQTVVNAKVQLTPGSTAVIPLQLYYGPSDYDILKKYDNKMENIVPFGSGVFAFVKYINRHFLLPAFNFLSKNVASMGIVILLLTLLIRLITSPILYNSYLSGAKMKALKPEIDALRQKFGDDKQGFGMEQMKLWKSAGVNPLGGCLPALLQIPIFMSLYYFFQSNIGLRGESFLWAKDLAQYDSIANLPFNIPFYGAHVSLFTLTATATSLLISLYSMTNMQDDSNPVMKYMPYIFPVMLLGVFNSLPAALTWYYTVSNVITLILQFVIQKYIINHDKILAQIEENRKKPVKTSKLQERIQAMQEANQKVQDMKNKNQRNK